MSDVFREVDEEVRREQLKKLWERYQYLIIGAVLTTLVVPAEGVLTVEDLVLKSVKPKDAARPKKTPTPTKRATADELNDDIGF